MSDKPARRRRRPPAAVLDALRLAARSAYTLEPEPVRLEQLVCRPAFRQVGLALLRQWCREEDWEAQRLRKADSWTRHVEAQVEVKKRRVDDWHLRSLQSLHDEALRLRCHPRVQPRSWESVAAFQLRVAQTLHDWQRQEQASRRLREEEDTAARTPPATGDDSVGSLPEGALADVTCEEYQESAHHILRRRLGVPEEEKDDVREPKKPRLVRANG